MEHASLYQGKIEVNDNELVDFEIGLVELPSQRRLVCDFLDRMYGWRGYKGKANPHERQDSFTFAVSIGSEIVATLTLNMDSAQGLAAEATFGDVLDSVRREPGARLCELARFASQPSVNSKHLLACLFHTIFIFGAERFGCTDLFIEVNPRHVRFYETMLGFRKCGYLRTNEAVAAPSQLMRLKVEDIGRNIESRARSNCEKSARSLYPLFLPAGEQNQVRYRLKQRHQATLAAAARAGAAMQTQQGPTFYRSA